MSVDNSEVIRNFVPEKDDGDTYVYTELLDRRKTKGNNGFRLVKSFFHRDRESFDYQLPAIKELCTSYGCRAYTRISPRSFKKTAGVFLKMVAEAFVASNYDGMKTLYNKACGNVSPNTKYWMLDIDTEVTSLMEEYKNHVIRGGARSTPAQFVCEVPSKTGTHWIITPYNPEIYTIPFGMELKKDANQKDLFTRKSWLRSFDNSVKIA